MLAFKLCERKRKYFIIIHCIHRGSSYTHCPQMAFVLIYEVSFIIQSRNFTTSQFYTNFQRYLPKTVLVRENVEKGDECQLGKQNKNKRGKIKQSTKRDEKN